MKLTTLISIIVATLAIAGIVVAFLGNASPYVTIPEAKRGGQDLHVVGILDKGSLKSDMRAGLTTFTILDEQNDRLPVRYEGPPVQNLMSADRVVCVGESKEGVLHANKLLVKCPSKYEGQKK